MRHARWIGLLGIAALGACGDDNETIPLCEEESFKKCTTAENEEGTQQCTNGVWGECVPTTPAVCTTGEMQACSTQCGAGMEICVENAWKNCDAPKPVDETCDGTDNDCDNEIDETCDCIHGTCEACYTGAAGTQDVGQCRAGQRCCVTGVWGPCTNEILPASDENCGDNIDNDCNRTVNDGCTCTVGTKQPCGTDEGVCAKGEQTCVLVGSDGAWGECAGDVEPRAESEFGCNGQDEDCDGVADNGLPADLWEANNTCATARHHILHDTDTAPTSVPATIYPSGDVDYYQITALESNAITLPPCICIWPFCEQRQCHYLEVEVVSPTVSGLSYQYTVLEKSCVAPVSTTTGTGKKVIIWEGLCGPDDTKDWWLRVEPTASSDIKWSCQPYGLRVRYTRTTKALDDTTPC